MRTGPQTPDGQSGDTLIFADWFTTRREAKSVAVKKEWQARFAAQPRASWPSACPPVTELTEAEKTLAKKRQELARVIERLRSPPLSHGIARELRKQQFIRRSLW